ncbi:MAG: hypothetical protein IJN02_11770 [Bacteroidales bacterium]|nr:hypothetical protein [Bacteroidales bacterium]
MSNIFDIKRFGRYIVSDLKQCIANFGISFLLLTFMGVIIYAGTTITGLLLNSTWNGPGIVFRAITFGVCLTILVITMPGKCYGYITDKKSGSLYLMVPASTLEKFLSMVFMMVVVFPSLFLLGYLGTDFLLCSVDKTCGEAIIRVGGIISEEIKELNEASLLAITETIKKPILYIDDIIGIITLFLMGSVIFRKHKVAYTLLAALAFSMVTSTITAPLMLGDMAFLMNPEIMNDTDTAAALISASSTLSNISVIDTVNDLILITGTLAGTYWRLKTLKF